MNRLKEKWNNSKKILTVFLGEKGKDLDVFLKTIMNQKVVEKLEMTPIAIIEASKEIIFSIENDYPRFNYIMYCFNPESGKIEIGNILSSADQYSSNKEMTESVLKTLAFASICEIPVYPNTLNDEVVLKKYYKEMLLNGFFLNDSDGAKKRYIITKTKAYIDNLNNVEDVDVWNISPVEIALLKDTVVKEFEKYKYVDILLRKLQSAIMSLEDLLGATTRNEIKIKNCIIENPILLGTEYIKVIWEHKLGSEFIMDYALQKVNGLYDLVEIESSNLILYNKKGDPSQYLIHAEQQVLDWLDWIEKNNTYANVNLPGITSPVGFVIIGRKKNLTSIELEKLKRRNISYYNKIQIMTYDDVVERAKYLLKNLIGVS